MIHIDIDAAEIGKNVAAYVPIVGDAKTVLAQLLDDTKLCHREWIQEIRNFELPMQLPKEPKITKCTDCTAPNMKNSDVPPPCRKKDSVDPKVVLEMVSDLLQDDLIVATDVGQNQMWAAQYVRVKKPRSFITSGGLGTMGYGLPAAIGARLGRPDRSVVYRRGTSMLSEHDISIPASVRCTSIWLLDKGGRPFSTKAALPDLHRVNPDSRSCRHRDSRCKDQKQDQLGLLQEALTSEGPYLVEVSVDPDESVWPMVAPGAALCEMFHAAKAPTPSWQRRAKS